MDVLLLCGHFLMGFPKRIPKFVIPWYNVLKNGKKIRRDTDIRRKAQPHIFHSTANSLAASLLVFSRRSLSFSSLYVLDFIGLIRIYSLCLLVVILDAILCFKRSSLPVDSTVCSLHQTLQSVRLLLLVRSVYWSLFLQVPHCCFWNVVSVSAFGKLWDSLLLSGVKCW